MIWITDRIMDLRHKNWILDISSGLHASLDIWGRFGASHNPSTQIINKSDDNSGRLKKSSTLQLNVPLTAYWLQSWVETPWRTKRKTSRHKSRSEGAWEGASILRPPTNKHHQHPADGTIWKCSCPADKTRWHAFSKNTNAVLQAVRLGTSWEQLCGH